MTEDKNKELLFPCQSYSLENSCCSAYYNAFISKKFPLISFDMTMLDKNCKGLSNPSKCVGFRPIGYSELDARIDREKLNPLRVIKRRKLI